jgi:thioredoxin reductase (NADPH)
MADNVHKTLILGSGPAGYTAAIYAARANLQPVVMLKGMQPGGQLTTTTEVENYPGFPEGVMGPEMMELFEKQAERFGTEIVAAEGATKSICRSAPSRSRATWARRTTARRLIISTGASANYLGLENELAMIGRGVSACATCDGFFFKGKDVCVVGGGDSACEEAHYLTHHAAKVHMLVRRDELRASKIMQERVLQNPKIEMQWNTSVVDVLGRDEGKVTALQLKNNTNGEIFEQATDGLFLAIGHTPNTQIFKGALDMDEVGYIITAPDSTATNVPGVFAAGDCQDSVYRQAVTAAGSGCMAAIEAERWLESQG